MNGSPQLAVRNVTRSILAALGVLTCLGVAACRSSGTDDAAHTTAATQPTGGDADEPSVGDVEAQEEEEEEEEARHFVVFADRTSHAYLLFLRSPIRPEPPSRAHLAALVDRAHRAAPDAPAAVALRRLIDTQPHDTAADPQALEKLNTAAGQAELAADNQDLLGLAIDVLPTDETGIPRSALEDPVLTRGLDDADSLGLTGRKWAILLRADYRNQEDVRGLRLLQELAGLLAVQQDAVILDADTWESWSTEAFEARRLRPKLDNAAAQIAVIPFPEEDGVRLATRGMRRFGAPDLELRGLALDADTLQRGTDLLLGLARVMVREGEADATGFAVEAPEELAVEWSDTAIGYAAAQRVRKKCEDCPAQTYVHLVKRAPKPTDAPDHLMVEVVAPRELSDAREYDHGAWVMRALTELFGEPAESPQAP